MCGGGYLGSSELPGILPSVPICYHILTRARRTHREALQDLVTARKSERRKISAEEGDLATARQRLRISRNRARHSKEPNLFV
jgi:hypothetical protein